MFQGGALKSALSLVKVAESHKETFDPSWMGHWVKCEPSMFQTQSAVVVVHTQTLALLNVWPVGLISRVKTAFCQLTFSAASTWCLEWAARWGVLLPTQHSLTPSFHLSKDCNQTRSQHQPTTTDTVSTTHLPPPILLLFLLLLRFSH